uniref:Uncharacterized protein n=1 Tax=Eutreptiella gymnastica TaxID=73025 RepID=A0A7S4FXW8_9EUGL
MHCKHPIQGLPAPCSGALPVAKSSPAPRLHPCNAPDALDNGPFLNQKWVKLKYSKLRGPLNGYFLDQYPVPHHKNTKAPEKCTVHLAECAVLCAKRVACCVFPRSATRPVHSAQCRPLHTAPAPAPQHDGPSHTPLLTGAPTPVAPPPPVPKSMTASPLPSPHPVLVN